MSQRVKSGLHATPATQSGLKDTVVVLVHHKNYDVIKSTAQAIIEQGFSARQILVVDNSELEQNKARLVESLPSGIETIFIPNRGYGNAVNHGVAWWADAVPAADRTYVLIATHEVAPRRGAVSALRHELEMDPSVGAAGPTLVSGDAEPFIWSAGGRLSAKLGIPRHYMHRDTLDLESLGRQQPARRDWLDGAFVLYRWPSLQNGAMDETFFMYMEETDLHLRLGQAGIGLKWVPSAIVWQSSGGIPPFYLSRNLRLLYSRTGRQSLGRLAVPIDVGRRAISDVLKGRAGRDTVALLHGLFAPLPKRTSRTTSVSVINPLGVALHHYCSEVIQNLTAAGVEAVSVRSFPEPSAGDGGRLSWIITYIRALRSARKRHGRDPRNRLLILWPALGYLDTVLIAFFYRGKASIVLHDPNPLVRAVGYGRISLALARCVQGTVDVIVHGESAHAVVQQQNAVGSVTRVPHPMLPVLPRAARDSESERGRPLIRVLGQYKPDRDLDALAAISARIGGRADLEIWGRGWPTVDGWHVTDGFLTEPEFAFKLAEADVIVIPYTRFFQSGIAVRALEAGVAVVGPRVPSLTDLLGVDSRLLVVTEGGGEAWAEAIDGALQAGSEEVRDMASRAQLRAVDGWASWVNQPQPTTRRTT